MFPVLTPHILLHYRICTICTRGDGCYVRIARDNSYVDVVTILYVGDLTDLKVVSFRRSEFAFSSYEWIWLLHKLPILIRHLLSWGGRQDSGKGKGREWECPHLALFLT